MKVLFLLQYADIGSSSKYRVLIYKNFFDKEFKTKYSYFWNNLYLKKFMNNKKKFVIPIFCMYIFNTIKRLVLLFFVAPKYDAVFIQRCLIPYLRPTFLKHLKNKNVKIIYDIDDALHTSSMYNCNNIAKLSDVVIVGNKKLREHYLKFNNNICFIPTVDDDRKYERYVEDTFSKKCIGWIGSHSTIENINLIIEPLNQLMEEYPNIYLKVISDDLCGLEKKIRNIKFVKWTANTYIEEMKEFTVGIMPLINNEFNKGKCGFKLVQYLDLKKPVVATDLGENKIIVSNYGYICQTNEEWYSSLKTLLLDDNKYNDCIENIENTFKEKYGFINNKNRLINIIKKVKEDSYGITNEKY